MKSKIVIIAAEGSIRDFFSRYFEEKGFRSLIIERDKIISEQQLVITEDSVKFCDEDLIKQTAAAIVLDSGYMWPQPTSIPSEEQWSYYENNLDEYLRNERESASLWYSLLEILNDCVPVCINPQEAYTAEAFKPWALDILSEQGIATAPFIAGNNKKQISNFLEKNRGFVLSLPITSYGRNCWDWQEQFDHENAPVFLQALSSKEEVKIVVANGKAIHTDPEGSSIDDVIDKIPLIQSVLKIHLAELVFRYSDRLVLSDFKAAPDLSNLNEGTLTKLLDEILSLIEKTRA